MASKKVSREEEIGTKEVAEIIGMSRQWVQKAAVRGDIPSFRLSKRGFIHFRRRDIEKWYAERANWHGASP